MSFLQTRSLVLSLVLSLALALLWPAIAFAQMPATLPASDPPQIQIKVAFVTVRAADLDKSGVTFDRVPLAQPTANPAPEGTFLQYAVGDTAVRLFQTLIHTSGKTVQAPLITTPNNVTATIQVNTQVPDGKAGFRDFQAGLAVTPRINNDASITLSVASQVADINAMTPAAEPQATILRTIRSGDVIAVAGLPLSPDRLSNDQKLLVFITPIRLGTDAQKAETARPGLPAPAVQDTSSTLGLTPGKTVGKTVSIDVYNADLGAVVALLERQVGLRASVLGAGQTYKPVYVRLNKAPLSEALGTIARSAGAQIIRDERGIYVFSPLPGATRMPAIPAMPPYGGSSVTVTP